MKTGLPKRRVRRFVLWTAAALSFAILVGVGAAAIVLQSPSFEGTRRDLAGGTIGFYMDRPITIHGNVNVILAKTVKVEMTNVGVGDVGDPTDQEDHRWKQMDISFSAWGLLSGDFEISGLVISGARFEILDEAEAGRPSDDDPWGKAIARVPSNILNARVSDSLEFRDIVVSFGDKKAGWNFEFVVKEFSSKKTEDNRGIELKLLSTLNNAPLSLSGRVQNPRSPIPQSPDGPFKLAASLAGMTVDISGKMNLSNPVAVVDADAKIGTKTLVDVLKVFGINDDGNADGDFTGRLSGPLDGLRLDRAVLKIKDRRGRNLAIEGGIGNLGTGDGVDLAFVTDLREGAQRQAQKASVFEASVTGIKGQVAGSIDRLEVEKLFVLTNVASAELEDIGPITLGRMIRAPNGKLGFPDIRILDGPKDRPSFDISASITDALDISGIKFAGDFSLAMADILVAKPGPQSEGLGRIKGRLAGSDTGGTLRLTELFAEAEGTDLISLSLRKASLQKAGSERDTYKIELDIPNFDAVAERLGQSVEVGAIGYSGALSVREKGGLTTNGTVRVGQTKLALLTDGAFRDGARVVSIKASSDLLDKADVERALQVYRAYIAADTKDVKINLDEKVAAKSRVDMDLRVSKIRGFEDSVENIRAKGNYEGGVARLDRLRMEFFGGAVDASARVDTNRKPVAFATKGQVEKLNMGRFLSSLDLTPLVTGALNTTFDLSARTGNTSEILDSLNGTVKAEIWGGGIGSREIELGGRNFVQWMVQDAADSDAAKLVCAVTMFKFTAGQAVTKQIVIETENVQIVGVGSISLPKDTIDLSFQTRPMKVEFANVATAFTIKGKLTAPEVKLISGGGTGRLLSEALTSPLNILGLVVPTVPSDENRQPCVLEQTP